MYYINFCKCSFENNAYQYHDQQKINRCRLNPAFSTELIQWKPTYNPKVIGGNPPITLR